MDKWQFFLILLGVLEVFLLFVIVHAIEKQLNRVINLLGIIAQGQNK